MEVHIERSGAAELLMKSHWYSPACCRTSGIQATSLLSTLSYLRSVQELNFRTRYTSPRRWMMRSNGQARPLAGHTLLQDVRLCRPAGEQDWTSAKSSELAESGCANPTHSLRTIHPAAAASPKAPAASCLHTLECVAKREQTHSPCCLPLAPATQAASASRHAHRRLIGLAGTASPSFPRAGPLAHALLVLCCASASGVRYSWVHAKRAARLQGTRARSPAAATPSWVPLSAARASQGPRQAARRAARRGSLHRAPARGPQAGRPLALRQAAPPPLLLRASRRPAGRQPGSFPLTSGG